MSKTLRELLIARKGSESLNAFAARINVPVVTLHTWLNDERQIGVEGLRKISLAFKNDNELREAIMLYVFGEKITIAEQVAA